MPGLYIHIPFCARKCHYCNFVITVSGNPAKHAHFLSVLEKEASHARNLIAGTRFDTLYIGGGTPSALSLKEIDELFSIVHTHFDLKEDAEISFEANPGDLNENKAGHLKKRGVHRVSLGVQTFHDRTLEALNRSHNARDIYESVAYARKAGIDNLNLDLMLSLPGESLKELQYSMTEAMKLSPEHISLYELTIEAHTVFGSRFEKGQLALPDDDTQTRMLAFARAFLKQQGFYQYELLNYAKKGFESRHNLLYWANDEYLGLGPGAYSYWNGRRFRNAESYEVYMSKIEAGDWSPCEDEALSAEKKEIETFLLALRKTDGAPLNRFRGLINGYGGAVERLTERGLLSSDGTKIRLTERGQLFAETVFAELSLKA